MPRGIPNKSTATSSETEQLKAAIAELEERLDIERRRETQRRKLRTFLGRMTLLTKKDATAIVIETLQAGGKGAQPVTSKHAQLTTTKLRTDRLKPAKGKVGMAIRAARLKAGISTTALAKLIGTASGVISQYETGKSQPSPKKRERLAKALGGLPPGLFVNGDARHATT